MSFVEMRVIHAQNLVGARIGVAQIVDEVILVCPVGSVVLGNGNRFSIAWPIGLNRLAGIMLCAKQPAALVVEQV